jgi:uncharacterized protein (TIGR03084 family)
MLTQAYDFRDESAALFELLQDLPDQDWERPTQFKDWTCNDVIGHLHIFNHAARVTLRGADELRAFFGRIMAARAQGETLLSYTRRWLDGVQGGRLLGLWRDSYRELADIYANEDPARRVAWGGPDMSVRSCISARQMETWAHGQAMFDLLGVTRVEGERLKNVAIIGVNTFGWTFVNRKLPLPTVKPHVRLTSPGGEIWEWNADQPAERVVGSAFDFCAVVTQTRNLADTRLEVSGSVAAQWMKFAQCFAGPPEDPPAPGKRVAAK